MFWDDRAGWSYWDEREFSRKRDQRTKSKSRGTWDLGDEIEYAALRLKREHAREQSRKRKEKEKIKQEVKKALERQRKELRRRIITRGYAKFYKRVKGKLKRTVLKLIRSSRTKDLDVVIERAVRQAYGVEIKSNIQQRMLESIDFWMQASFYLIMPEAREFSMPVTAGKSIMKTAIVSWLFNKYKNFRNNRKYKKMYLHFEKIVTPALKRYAQWYVSELSNLALKLEPDAQKVYRGEVELRTVMTKVQANSIFAALLNVGQEFAPDRSFLDE